MRENHRQRRGRARVVIAGGGVAALETVLALRAVIGEVAEIELVAPESDFLYTPMIVSEPFDLGQAARFDLEVIAHDLRVGFRRAAVASVDTNRRRILTSRGERLPYDGLVIAAGARRTAWLPGAITFADRAEVDPLRGLLELLDSGDWTRFVFAAAPDAAWSLPLYELALLTESRLTRRGGAGRITIVTPEQAPLAIFGEAVSDGVSELLRERGIDCWCESCAAFFRGPRLQVVPDGMLFVDAVVALAHLEGRSIAGIPSDRRGFIPTDEYGRVPGVDAVYAAGDGTTGAIKQGGIATQQADTVALQAAADLGAPVEPQPLRPVLRGLLLTGDAPLYLQANTQAGVSTIDSEPPWWPPTKIAGQHLGPYLAYLARTGRAVSAA